MMRVLRALDALIGLACTWGTITCLCGLFLMLLTAVTVRLLPWISLSGYDEIVELLFAWLTFLGALALWREGALYRVTVIEAALPLLPRRALGVCMRALMLGFALVMAVKGYVSVRDAGEITPFLGLDKTYWHMAVPLTGAIMALYAAAGLWRALRARDDDAAGNTIIG